MFLPVSTSQVARITGMSHCAPSCILNDFFLNWLLFQFIYIGSKILEMQKITQIPGTGFIGT
jgi:hypothetical protein